MAALPLVIPIRNGKNWSLTLHGEGPTIFIRFTFRKLNKIVSVVSLRVNQCTQAARSELSMLLKQGTPRQIKQMASDPFRRKLPSEITIQQMINSVKELLYPANCEEEKMDSTSSILDMISGAYRIQIDPYRFKVDQLNAIEMTITNRTQRRKCSWVLSYSDPKYLKRLCDLAREKKEIFARKIWNYPEVLPKRGGLIPSALRNIEDLVQQPERIQIKGTSFREMKRISFSEGHRSFEMHSTKEEECIYIIMSITSEDEPTFSRRMSLDCPMEEASRLGEFIKKTPGMINEILESADLIDETSVSRTYKNIQGYRTLQKASSLSPIRELVNVLSRSNSSSEYGEVFLSKEDM